MSPLVAAELTREQAIFYLQEEKQVLADTFRSQLRIDRSNKKSNDIDCNGGDENTEVVEDSIEEYYAKLRLKYTLTADKHAEAD